MEDAGKKVEIVEELLKATKLDNLMNLGCEVQQHARCTAEEERPVKVIDLLVLSSL